MVHCGGITAPGQNRRFMAKALLPEIPPLPTAKIFSTWYDSILIKQLTSSSKILSLKRLLGEYHMRSVSLAARIILLFSRPSRIIVSDCPLLLGNRSCLV